jgi:hypothetical protein
MFKQSSALLKEAGAEIEFLLVDLQKSNTIPTVRTMLALFQKKTWLIANLGRMTIGKFDGADAKLHVSGANLLRLINLIPDAYEILAQ